MKFFTIWLVALLSVSKPYSLALKLPTAAGSMGPLKGAVVNEVTLCDDLPDTDYKVTTDLKTIDSKGTKAVDITASIPKDIGKNLKFKLGVSKWTDNGWEPNTYKAEGNVCEYFNKFIPKLWKKASEQIQPKFNPNCLIKKGEYKLMNFQAQPSDIGVPAILYGKFLLNLKIILDGKPIFCRNIEVVSQT